MQEKHDFKQSRKWPFWYAENRNYIKYCLIAVLVYTGRLAIEIPHKWEPMSVMNNTPSHHLQGKEKFFMQERIH